MPNPDKVNNKKKLQQAIATKQQARVIGSNGKNNEQKELSSSQTGQITGNIFGFTSPNNNSSSNGVKSNKKKVLKKPPPNFGGGKLGSG